MLAAHLIATRPLTFWPQGPACQATAMHCTSTKFGVDSSTIFSCNRADTQTDKKTDKVTEATDHTIPRLGYRQCGLLWPWTVHTLWLNDHCQHEPWLSSPLIPDLCICLLSAQSKLALAFIPRTTRYTLARSVVPPSESEPVDIRHMPKWDWQPGACWPR